MKHAIEERVKEKLPGIQRAIRTETGKTVPEDVLAGILAAPMADVATEVTIQASYAYAGPMPSPHVMAGYVQLFPGAAEQLFRQFEDEQKHRHRWEDNALLATSRERRRRDVGAYLIAGVGLICAGYIAYLGATTVAAILAGAIVLGGGALVLGRQFLASHSKDGIHVSIEPDGSNSHTDLRSQKTSRKQKKSNPRLRKP